LISLADQSSGPLPNAHFSKVVHEQLCLRPLRGFRPLGCSAGIAQAASKRYSLDFVLVDWRTWQDSALVSGWPHRIM
jgi:hypothetical protein